MANGSVRVEGAARLRRTMRAAGHDLSDLKAANKGAAGIAAAAARPLTPVLSGRLATSVRAAGTVSAGIIRAGRKSVPYAGLIHWGAPAKGARPAQAARPFLTQGARTSEPVWLPIFEADMHAALAQVKGK